MVVEAIAVVEVIAVVEEVNELVCEWECCSGDRVIVVSIRVIVHSSSTVIE